MQKQREHWKHFSPSFRRKILFGAKVSDRLDLDNGKIVASLAEPSEVDLQGVSNFFQYSVRSPAEQAYSNGGFPEPEFFVMDYCPLCDLREANPSIPAIEGRWCEMCGHGT